jgi:protein TonB
MTFALRHAARSPAVSPRSPRRAASPDALTPLQRRTMVGVIVVLHAALAYGLLQVREVREGLAETAPLLFSMVAPAPKPASPSPAAPPSPKPPPAARPVLSTAPAPVPAPAPFTAPAAPPEPVVEAAAPVAASPLDAPPAPPAPPKIIPASAVQYLEPPPLVYPRASRRAGEAGRVVLRVFIDEAGLPREVQLSRSSGFARLDEAAASAVLKARFKPYSDNGRAIAGWALVPLTFDLEK